MFEWLVHSSTRLKMMKMFFRDTEKPLYGLEISQALNASPGTTHRELNAMIEQNVLKKKKEGALVLYSLNTHHPYFHELKKAVFPPKKKTNRVLFMSDLHLSTLTPKDLVEDFHLFLDYAEENATDVVFLGDMVEMLKGNDVFQTYLLHKPLFDRVVSLSHDIKVTYVVGNHDCFLGLLRGDGQSAKFFDSSIVFTQQYWNKQFNLFATHGNMYVDYSVLKGFTPKRSVEYPGSVLLKAMKAAGVHSDELHHVGELADKAADFVEYTREHGLQTEKHLEEKAAELIHEQDYSYVVMGHSHKASFKQLNHGIYFNCGSWVSEKKRSFVEIDKDGGALVDIAELR